MKKRRSRLLRSLRLWALFFRSVGLLLFLEIRLKIKEVREKMKKQKEDKSLSGPLPANKTEARPGVPLSLQTGREVKPAFRPRSGDPLPQAPEGTKPGNESSLPSSTISPAGKSGVLIDDEIAGELANAPFTLINIFEPAWEAMNDAQMLKIGRALRVYLENKGITELKHPELLILVSGYGYLSQQFKNVRKAAKERKVAKLHVTDDRRAEGDGKNIPGVVGDQKIEGR